MDKPPKEEIAGSSPASSILFVVLFFVVVSNWLVADGPDGHGQIAMAIWPFCRFCRPKLPW